MTIMTTPGMITGTTQVTITKITPGTTTAMGVMTTLTI